MTDFRYTRLSGVGSSLAISAPAFMVAVMFLITPVEAADDERISVSLGVFVTDRDTKTRLSGDVPDSGTDVDLEKDLGFRNSDSVFRLDGYFRFGERSRLDFSVFDLSRDSSKQLDREIEWNGELYPVSASVDAELDLTIYKVAYTWAFMRSGSDYLGVSGGLYIADIGTSLSANALGQVSNNSLTAPLPVVGLRGQYGLSEKWSLRGSAEIFAIDYDAYSGSLYDIYAGLDYQFSRHLAAGVGFNAVDLDVGVDKSGFGGDLNWQYQGLMVFLKLDY